MFDKLYNRWLFNLEIGVVYLLVALVTTGSGFLILYRNTLQAGWDVAWINKAIYGCTFYLCLMGTVLASRRASHISIDVLHYVVGPRQRELLERFSLIVAALASLALAVLAWRYTFHLLGSQDMFLPSSHSWIWKARTWKAPMILCFSLMAFHLTVQGLRPRTQPEA